jgi:hypothetical protein
LKHRPSFISATVIDEDNLDGWYTASTDHFIESSMELLEDLFLVVTRAYD